MQMNSKSKKVILAVALVAALGIGFYLVFGQGSSLPAIGGTPVASGGRAFPVAERDAQVYSAVDVYMRAQVENDRDKLPSLMTEGRWSSWTDASYLLNEAALRDFDEIRLDDLRLGVITFGRRGGDETAALLATYNLQFINGEDVVLAVPLLEELGLIFQDGKWLVDYNLRSEAGRES